MARKHASRKKRKRTRSPSPGATGALPAGVPGPEAALREGFRLHQAGDLEGAAARYEALLERAPDHPDALHLLGVTRYQEGDFAEAESLIRRAIERNPGAASYRSNLGNALKSAGRPREAETAYREALEIDPRFVDALRNLGIVLSGMGRHSEALEILDRALVHHPGHFAILLARGNALRMLGKPAEAVAAYDAALAAEPGHAEALCGKACALRDRGEYEDALSVFKEALRRNPRYADAFNNLGNLFKDMGKIDDAVAAYARAVRLRPDYVLAHVNLGNIRNDQGRVEEAIAAYREARRLAPGLPWAAAGEAKALMKRGDFEAALALIRPAVEADGDNYDVAIAYAQLARRFGHHSEAIGLLERILAGNPADIDQRRQLHFSLAALLDRAGRFDEAFDHCRRANRLRPPRFDPARHEQAVTSLIHHFDAGYEARLPRAVNRSETPVFIVGMPRSGTSLVEQILASHPRAHGAGELPDIPKIARDLSGNLGGGPPYPACLSRMSSRNMDAAAQHYLARLRRLAPEARRVTDKMPQNFFHLGLLSLMFPGCRIVHCVRNPADTALSIYFQNFSGGLAYAFDLENIAAYYVQYRRLMAHWRAVLPIPVLDVRYEDLVARQEAVSREMIAFLGLDWDDRCLEFHRTRRDVSTASVQQVREPIYRGSVERWRRYEKHLGPLLDRFRECHVET